MNAAHTDQGLSRVGVELGRPPPARSSDKPLLAPYGIDAWAITMPALAFNGQGPMRFAIDVHSLAGPPHGITTYTRHLMEEAASAAPCIEFLALKPLGVQCEHKALDNIVQHDLKGGALGRVGFEVRNFTRRLQCDAYHTSYWLPMALPKNPLVTIHDVLPDTHPQFFGRTFGLAARKWFRYSARHAAHVFTVSEYSRQMLMELYGLPSERVSVTTCAVEHERFASGIDRDLATVCDSIESGNYFLMVGRFDRRKDHATVLQSHARLSKRYLDFPKLVIAGSQGPLEHKIREQIVREKLERVTVLKGVHHDDLPTLYAHSLATLSPSMGEGFGLPLLEAMAAGSPVICARNTAQTELVNGAGLLFETSNAEQLAAHMLVIAEGPTLRRDLTEYGRKRAGQYTWKASAQALLKVVQHLN